MDFDATFFTVKSYADFSGTVRMGTMFTSGKGHYGKQENFKHKTSLRIYL
jgi:hypothetical protein